jgi:very-short-patch-repair endonuclease
MANGPIITQNINSNFQAAKKGLPVDQRDFAPDIDSIRARAFADGQKAGQSSLNKSGHGSSALTSAGPGMAKFASGGIVYTQPQFFSPIHTPINWQIPVKRREQYQWCITPWSLITYEDFTRVPIHTLNVGDIVISHDGTNGEITKVMTRDVDEDIFYIDIQSEESQLEITGNHQVYCVRSENIACKYKVNNKRPQKCTHLLHGTCSTVKPGNTSCAAKLKIEDVPVCELKENDYLVCPSSDFNANTVEFNLNKARLLGYYAAEGNVYINKKKSICGVKFTLHIDEKNTIGKEISDYMLSEFGIKMGFYNYPDRPNTLSLMGQSESAFNFFSKYCPGHAPVKKLNAKVMRLPINLQKNLLACYICGDGHFKIRNGILKTVSITSASYDLLSQAKQMLINTGAGSGKIYKGSSVLNGKTFIRYTFEFSNKSCDFIRDAIVKDIPSNANATSTKNSCPIANGYVLKRINKITKKRYTGPVFNIEVEGNHSYVANGVAVHNCRFFWENEPKVAQALEFHSKFPINSFTNECSNRYVKRYFDKLSDNIHLLKWLRIISHEIHLLGDCFPFLEVDCDKCHGKGFDDRGNICEHDGGSFKRLVVLNPECVEVYSDPISPESLIAFMPNDELRMLITKRGPGFERFSPEIIKKIMTGQPIPLDNRNVSHIKYADTGYNKYGVGMLRRLFPILAYKTKLMTAQWIIAERLILPIKVAKVGSDERPASAGDLADINAKLSQVANDPNLTLVTHHAFELDWFGASLPVNAEILTTDGWMNYQQFKTLWDLNKAPDVASMSLEDQGNIVFQPAVAIHDYDFNGNMVRLTGDDIDLLVTPDHDVVVDIGDACLKKIKAIDADGKYLFGVVDREENKWSSTFLSICQKSLESYSGKAWCLTTQIGTIVVRYNGKCSVQGNSGKVLQLTNEFEIISQEILDGLGVNKVLLNGEGPTYSGAAIGVEVMIDKLEALRNDLSEWVEQKIYLPIAKMKGFIEVNEWGEKEYVYPRIKWDIMHLRDMQQMRQFLLQLHEKQAISTQTMLKGFDIDYDQEVELLRYERASGAAAGGGKESGGMGGGFGGGDAGGLPDLGGELGGDLGGGGGAPEAGGGLDLGGGDAGGAAGGAPAGGGMEGSASSSVANIRNFGGKVLKKKSREKISKYKEHIFQKKQDEASGYMRDEKGRPMLTSIERSLLKDIAAAVQRGEIRHNVRSQFPVQALGSEYSIDFAMPDLKLGIEVDGALFHSTPDQIASDKKRDGKLAQMGWTILRFTDKEVETKSRQIMDTIIQQQIKKETFIKEHNPQTK